MSEEGRAASELKPCPFCQQGVRAVVIKGAGYSLVGCSNLNCPASAIACDPSEWNIRAQPPTADAEMVAREALSKHSSAAFLSFLGQGPFEELVGIVATALSAAEQRGTERAIKIINERPADCWDGYLSPKELIAAIRSNQ